MGKAAVIAVGAVIFLGTYFLFNIQSTGLEAEVRLAEDEYEILARNASLTGLERARQILADDFIAYTNVTGTNDGGDYRFTATVNGSQVLVHSIGSSQTAREKTVEFSVQASYRQVVNIPPEAPPYMRHAVITDRDLIMRGDFSSQVYADGVKKNKCALTRVQGEYDDNGAGWEPDDDGYIYVYMCSDGTTYKQSTGNESSGLNANMHTNSNLEVNGSSAQVNGFGTYSLTAGPDAATLNSVFTPVENPTGAPSVYQVDPIAIPPLSTSSLASSLSPDSTTTGDALLSGSYALGGTREEPYVWHVTDNLTVDNALINGYAIFLVDGAVTISGDLNANASYDGPDESSVAVYSSSDLTVSGNTDIWAQLYVNGNVTLSGTVNVFGSLTTSGTVDFRGTVDLYYRRASPALTRMFQPDIKVLQQLTYSEW